MKTAILCCVMALGAAAQAWAGVSVVGGLVRSRPAQPGETYEAVILLKNPAAEAVDVRVYQTDYLFFADGTNLYGEPGSASRSNARWIAVSPARLSLAAGQTASVYVRVQVPADPPLSGTYWSLLMIEPEPEPVVSDGSPTPALGLRQVIRTGVQIVTEVGAAARGAVRFQGKRIIKDESGRFLELEVENVGDRLLAPAFSAELFQASGVSVGRFEGQKLRIYPGCSVRHRINLTDVPPGAFKAMVIGDNGDEHVFGAQYDLVLEE